MRPTHYLCTSPLEAPLASSCPLHPPLSVPTLLSSPAAAPAAGQLSLYRVGGESSFETTQSRPAHTSPTTASARSRSCAGGAYLECPYTPPVPAVTPWPPVRPLACAGGSLGGSGGSIVGEGVWECGSVGVWECDKSGGWVQPRGAAAGCSTLLQRKQPRGRASTLAASVLPTRWLQRGGTA